MILFDNNVKEYYKFIIILFKTIIIIFSLCLFLFKSEKNFQSIVENQNIKLNYPYKFRLSKNNKLFDIYFEIIFIKYCFSFKFNAVEIVYNVLFYDKDHNLVLPSDLTLFHDFHIFCSIKKTNYIYIDSLANVYYNKYICFEYFSLKYKLKLGIKIYENNEIFYTILILILSISIILIILMIKNLTLFL